MLSRQDRPRLALQRRELVQSLTRAFPNTALLRAAAFNLGKDVATSLNFQTSLREVIEVPALRMHGLDGLDTTVVAFTTDIPAFGGKWGQPFLVGPGTIHVAHTLEERVPKQQLLEAVQIYQRMVKHLCKRESK